MVYVKKCYNTVIVAGGEAAVCVKKRKKSQQYFIRFFFHWWNALYTSTWCCKTKHSTESCLFFPSSLLVNGLLFIHNILFLLPSRLLFGWKGSGSPKPGHEGHLPWVFSLSFIKKKTTSTTTKKKVVESKRKEKKKRKAPVFLGQ